MKINPGLGVLGPALVRRRSKSTKRPPWFVEVPPDTIDIALLPRINRYERGGLKFRSLGSTQQKLADRLAVFRDTMDEVTPGLAYSEKEMREGLEAVMLERLMLLEEAELKSQRIYGANPMINQENDGKSVSTQAMNQELEDLTGADDESAIQTVDLNKKLLNEPKAGEISQTSQVGAGKSKSEVEPPLQGIPTDWLVRRLESMQTGQE